MDVDPDTQGQGTPPGTPFDDGFMPSTTRCYTIADPTGTVHTENYVTPLYTGSQTTDHANVNTNQQPFTPENIRDLDMAAIAEATAAEAKALSAAADAAEAADAMEEEATTANAAEFRTRLAMK